MKYRAEIDGLRAIAILLVIFYHSGLPAFSGGYIGVDVFFIISGYLITQIIVSEINLNQFSLKSFYIRRSNRILPALFFVLVFTTLFSYVFLNPQSFLDYCLSLINVNTFTSNFYFLQNSGYFAPDAIEQPLLHTWTLAVEEQHYLLFPLLLILIGVTNKSRVVMVLSMITIISFIVSLYFLENKFVYANFYLIFSRAWELLIGALIAFVDIKKLKKRLSHVIYELIGWLGIFMIVMACFIFTEKSDHPSYLTLLPVIGSSLIIVFTADKTYLGQILSFKPLVYIGLISYSWYLWHHPILSFIHIRSVGTPENYLIFIGVLCSLILAIFSWKFVEKPFRTSGRKYKSHFYLYVVFTLGFILVGVWGFVTSGAPDRFKYQNFDQSMNKSPIKKSCHAKESNFIKPSEACQYFGSNISWAAMGDSHIAEPAYMLAKKLESNGEGIVQLSFGNCPPAYQIDLISPKGCKAWTEAAIDYIIKNNSIENVLIGYRYSKYLFGRNKPVYPNIPNGSPRYLFDYQNQNINHDQSRELIWTGLLSMIERLKLSGKKVYVMFPIPELPLDINEIIYPRSIFDDNPFLDTTETVTAEYYFQRNEFILNKLNKLPFDNSLIPIRPFEIFCSNDYCPAVIDNNAMYFDSNHLSLKGAEKLIQSITM